MVPTKKKKLQGISFSLFKVHILIVRFLATDKALSLFQCSDVYYVCMISSDCCLYFQRKSGLFDACVSSSSAYNKQPIYTTDWYMLNRSVSIQIDPTTTFTLQHAIVSGTEILASNRPQKVWL